MATIIKKTIPVLEMSCASCAASVETLSQSLEGVQSAVVNYANATLTVEFDPSLISLEKLREAVQNAGYDLLLVEEEVDEQEALEEMLDEKYSTLKRKTIGAVIFAFPVFLIGMFFMDMPYGNEIMWIFSTPVVFWYGRDFFKNAWNQLQHKTANMDTLVALSTSIAYFFSLFNMFFSHFWESRGIEAHVYFEASAVIIAFILLGRLLEERAKSNTSNAIKKLIGLQPKTVTIITDSGEEKQMSIEAVQKGHTLIVKPGEKIAVDGIVVSGESYVDESMLSGESLPLLKNEGEKVYAGTINQKGSFHYLAEKVGKETFLAHIIQSVQDAQGSKAPVQKLVDRIAAVFVPIVMGIALLALILWVILGGENGVVHGILAAVTVLVIACPCALGLATPTAIMVGVGKGADNGMLIKNAESLELSQKINAIILDKTGTITEGKPRVTDTLWKDENPMAIATLVAIERNSEHPLADAVIQNYPKAALVKMENFDSITGKGVKASLKDTTYWVGNRKLMEENQCAITQEFLAKEQQWTDEAKTVIWFANQEKVLAIIAIADQIKPTSKEAVAQMQAMGIETYILTGDNEGTAKAIAEQVGIKNYKAGMLPQDKADYVLKLQKEGKIVAMVGDGINDSTALATADVSIAMGKGSDIAMEVAKMTIISSDLKKIPMAINLSKQTVATIRQNLFWAFIYNVIGIPIAAGVLYPINGFLLNPMIAGAAMALSSVSVVSNSLRLKWRKL